MQTESYAQKADRVGLTDLRAGDTFQAHGRSVYRVDTYRVESVAGGAVYALNVRSRKERAFSPIELADVRVYA